MLSCTRMCSFSISFRAKDFPHCSQAWLFTPYKQTHRGHRLKAVTRREGAPCSRRHPGDCRVVGRERLRWARTRGQDGGAGDGRVPQEGTVQDCSAEEASVPASSGPGPEGTPTRVDEFMPLQVPDAVEDPPADLARVNVPGTGPKPQGGPQRQGDRGPPTVGTPLLGTTIGTGGTEKVRGRWPQTERF